MKNDLAPCLLRKKRKLAAHAITLKKAPYNYQVRHRDTAFDVWLEVLKPNETEWAKWEGYSD